MLPVATGGGAVPAVPQPRREHGTPTYHPPRRKLALDGRPETPPGQKGGYEDTPSMIKRMMARSPIPVSPAKEGLGDKRMRMIVASVFAVVSTLTLLLVLSILFRAGPSAQRYAPAADMPLGRFTRMSASSTPLAKGESAAEQTMSDAQVAVNEQAENALADKLAELVDRRLDDQAKRFRSSLEEQVRVNVVDLFNVASAIAPHGARASPREIVPRQIGPRRAYSPTCVHYVRRRSARASSRRLSRMRWAKCAPRSKTRSVGQNRLLGSRRRERRHPRSSRRAGRRRGAPT